VFPIAGRDASVAIKKFSLVGNRIKYDVYCSNLIVQMTVSAVTRFWQENNSRSSNIYEYSFITIPHFYLSLSVLDC
jgi:hypothetical protein